MKLKDFFNGLIEHKQKLGLNPKTLYDYKKQFENAFSRVGEKDIKNLKMTDVALCYEEARNHGKYGPLRAGVVFRQLLWYIKQSGYKLDFDWRDIRLPKEPKKMIEFLDPEEWERVQNAFDTNWIVGLRDRALVEVLRCTGMRIGEALGLDRSTIDWYKKEAKIKSGKAPYSEGKIYFTDESLSWVRRYLEMRNDNFEPLFVSFTGRRAKPCNIRRSIHTAMRRAGITKRIHPHIFRSTFATELLRGGADIKTVQNLCRHESERTTLRHYTAWTKERSQDEHRRIFEKKGFSDPVELTYGMSKVLIRHKILNKKI